MISCPLRPVRVLLVDDHPVVREGLRAMLNGDPDIEVVGEASNGEEALEKLNQTELDVVLTDIRMPGMGGIELTQRIKKTWPRVAIIILTIYDSETYMIEAIRAGAAGYLVKDSSKELLCHAIGAMAKGGTMIRGELLRQAVQGLLRSPRHPPGEQAGPMLAERLTARELDVIRLVAEGYGNKEIANELHLAEVTVKKHVQAIMGKLGASDRTNAAIVAARLGLVE